MSQSIIDDLNNQYRIALTEFCVSYFADKTRHRYHNIKKPEHLDELLRLDTQDSPKVPSARGAEGISCAQKFVHAAYQRLEPGYVTARFPQDDLKRWELYRSYSDWSALQMLLIYPENYMTPFVRPGMTQLFLTLMTDLNQTRLSTDSVSVAVRNYLKAFEGFCNLEVISAFLHGDSAVKGRYFFIGRERVAPYRYFWREAQIELTPSCAAISPAAWGPWAPIDVGVTGTVLDMRPVFWNGRPCLVWAELADELGKDQEGYVPYKLSINLAFRSQNGDWSPTTNLQNISYPDTPPALGSRLIATVQVSKSHPNGCLGVLFFNGAKAATPVLLDALFRPVAWYEGGWLEILAERFDSVLTVQHSLTEQSLPKVEASDEVKGTLTEFYGLHAILLTHSTGDKLIVQGFCKTNSQGSAANVNFDLTLTNPGSGQDPEIITGSFPGLGGWQTVSLTYTRAAGGFLTPLTFTFGASDSSTGYGRKKFVLTMTGIARFDPAVLEKNRNDAAQFLAFNKPDTLARVRLNSLFAPHLAALANFSLDALFDWTTQFLVEPASEAGEVNEPNGAFDGANGLYFWELFFYLHHLVAARLREENRYRESDLWLRRVFDPQAIADPSTTKSSPAKPDYWRCRPLVQKGNVGHECLTEDDPYAVAYSNPRHFRILTFIEFVKNLIEEGDWYYRQQTRDSLVLAKECYLQAQELMGDPPSARSVTDWQPVSLGALLDNSRTRPGLEAFERALIYSLADVPPSARFKPSMGMLASGPFKFPTNDRLTALFQLPQRRLNNLRNWLSIDGKDLYLPLYEQPGDPAQLLRDLAAGPNAGPRPMGGGAVVNAYNWRVTFEFALRSVQMLKEFGDRVLRFLEQRDTAQQVEIQQRHLVEQGEWTKAIQEKSIAQMEATLVALQQSREAVQQRYDGLSEWFTENVSAEEYRIMDDILAAKQLNQASTAMEVTAAAMALVPKIAGMSFGNMFPETVGHAVARGMQIASMGKSADAEKRAVAEGYRLRRREWGMQRNLALAELSALDEQIKAQEIAVEAARASEQLVLQTNRQALALYDFLQKRSTHSQLYDWLLAQLKALYYQAYDATRSLCLSVLASRAAQTGDYDSRPALPQPWSEKHHGLAAAEHLNNFLMNIERDHLQSYERRIERIKIISLRQLFDDDVEPQLDAPTWAKALQKLQTTGRLAFEVTELNLNRGSPGEYCRLIQSVEVDLPVLLAPYECAVATVRQNGSRTVISPSPRVVDFLHGTNDQNPPAGMVVNVRPGQQIGISEGVRDDGRVADEQDAGLLRTFACTGVVSSWSIEFPWWSLAAQAALLASITDIIITIRYTAKAGEAPFRLAVENLVTEAMQTASKRKAKRSQRHV